MPSVAVKFSSKEDIAKVVSANKKAYAVPEEAREKVTELEEGTTVRQTEQRCVVEEFCTLLV